MKKTRFIAAFMACVMTWQAVPSVADKTLAAVGTEETQVVEAVGTEETELAESVSGLSNESIIYDFFRNEIGLNMAATCGVLANIEQESLFSPTAHNPHDSGGTTSYGIVQWNSGKGAGNRLNSLKKWCSKKGLNYKSLDAQLKFIKYELENISYFRLEKLKAVPDTAAGAHEAALIWAKFFEGCSSSFHAERASRAKNVFWPYYKKGGINPQGRLEEVIAEGGKLYVRGWAMDEDNLAKSLEVKIYVDGKYYKTIKADKHFSSASTAPVAIKKTGCRYEFEEIINTDFSGDHIIAAYAVNTGSGKDTILPGSDNKTNITKEAKAPVISDVKVEADDKGYTVSCKVKDDSKLSMVKFPTWTKYNEKDDLVTPWKKAACYSGTYTGGRYVFRVNRSAHNDELGEYITSIYACDYFGNSKYCNVTWKYDVQLPTVKVNVGNGELNVRWSKVDGADKYRVFKYADGKCVKVADTNDVKYLIEDLDNDKEYGVLVLACYKGTWSTYTKADVIKATPHSTAKKENAIECETIVRSYSEKVQNVKVNVSTKYKVPMTYTTDNSKVTVDSKGKMTIAAGFSGKVKITATANATDKYKASIKSFMLYVPAKTTLKDLKSNTAGKMTVNWNKTDYATGYVIQYSKTADFAKGTTRLVTLGGYSRETYTVTRLASNTTYYVRVRTYKTTGDVTAYSAWSNVKKVKVK